MKETRFEKIERELHRYHLHYGKGSFDAWTAQVAADANHEMHRKARRFLNLD